MSHKIARIAIAVFMVVVASILSGCTQTSVQEATPTPQPKIAEPDIVAAGVLTVGVDYTHAPFSATTNNGVVGLDVDIAAAIADQLGLKLALVDVSDGSGSQKLAAREIDAVMGMPAESTVDPNVTVVGRYVANGTSLFTVTTNGEPIVATAQDVMSGKIASQQDSVSSHALLDEFKTVDIQGYESLDAAFEALENGEAKYVVSEAYSGGYLTSRADTLSFAGLIGTPKSVGVGIQAENSALGNAIQESLDTLATNGVINLLRSIWVGNLPVLTSELVVKPAGDSEPVVPAEIDTPTGDPTTLDETTTAAE